MFCRHSVSNSSRAEKNALVRVLSEMLPTSFCPSPDYCERTLAHGGVCREHTPTLELPFVIRLVSLTCWACTQRLCTMRFRYPMRRSFCTATCLEQHSRSCADVLLLLGMIRLSNLDTVPIKRETYLSKVLVHTA